MRYEVFSNNSEFPLKINTLGFSGDPDVVRFGPGRRNLYIIHYVLNGKGYFNGNSVCRGQGFLIRPGMDEEYHPEPSDPWELVWIISSDSAVETVFDRYGADEDTMIFDYNSVPVLVSIANEITLKSNRILDSMETMEMFLRIVNSHMHNGADIHRKANSEVYLDFCVDYIENNIHKKITVDELSALIGVSQPYLYKIFRKKFDMSPKQYLTKHKMNYAKKLLAGTDMTVTEIANSVGYGDILAFSKAFSSGENISPKKYRLNINKS